MKHRAIRSGLFFLMIAAAALSWPVAASAAPRNSDQPLKRISTIDLGDIDGRLDRITLDTKRNRLLITAINAGEMLVVDEAQGQIIKHVSNLQRPQGVLYLPDFDVVVVACAGSSSVRFLNADDYRTLGQVNGIRDADALQYDPKTKQIYVTMGRNGLGVIDVETRQLVTSISAGGIATAFVMEQHGSRIYVSLSAPAQISVIDRTNNAIVAVWPMKEAYGNGPVALDEEHNRLFVACRRPARLLVLDTNSGATVATPQVLHDVDDVFYDSASDCVFLSSGGGTADVFRQTSPDSYRLIAREPTASSARTSWLAADRDRYYVLCSKTREGGQPQVIVFDTGATEGDQKDSASSGDSGNAGG